AEDDVERADDGGDVCEHVSAGQKIHGLKMGKGRRTDLALVGSVGAVGDQIDAELSFWCLDSRVDLSGGHVMTFGVELEMLDSRLHGAFHLRAKGWDDLAVFHRHGPLTLRQTQSLEALLHDAYGLAHLLHANEIAVVTIAVLADRNIEFEVGIAFIRLSIAQVPGSTTAAHHDAGEAETPRIRQFDHADVDVALLEDPILGQKIFEIVAGLEEWVAKGPDIVDEFWWQILMHAA